MRQIRTITVPKFGGEGDAPTARTLAYMAFLRRVSRTLAESGYNNTETGEDQAAEVIVAALKCHFPTVAADECIPALLATGSVEARVRAVTELIVALVPLEGDPAR